jgi:hypothetical protein
VFGPGNFRTSTRIRHGAAIDPDGVGESPQSLKKEVKIMNPLTRFVTRLLILCVPVAFVVLETAPRLR